MPCQRTESDEYVAGVRPDVTAEGPPRHVAFASVAIGGFVGAVSRYGLAVSFDVAIWGTLVANVVGAFLLGAVTAEIRVHGRLSERSQLLLATGFCSSFTTYSTFASEVVELAIPLAAGYVGATYGLGLLAVLAGQAAVRWSA